MATGTNVRIHDGAHQFRGVFGFIWVVEFVLDSGSIGSNATVVDTVTIPGLRRATDVVLGFTHSAASDAEVGDEVFVSADDTLGIRRHNIGAGPNNPRLPRSERSSDGSNRKLRRSFRDSRIANAPMKRAPLGALFVYCGGV